MRNPFTPSFGISPPLLVGRDDLLDEFAEALENGPGSPGRATLYTGARGTGKTVLLTAVEKVARDRQWEVISETANSGMLRRIVDEHLPELLARIDSKKKRRRAGGVSASVLGTGGGGTWTTEDTHAPDRGLRAQLAAAADILGARGAGLLVTVDEVHRQQIDDLARLCAELQHRFRDEQEVAFAAAGLPATVSDALAHDPLTFLRRADRHHLGAVNLDDVAQAICRPIEEAGRRIDAEALSCAARATSGYPFMIQLVGYHIWRLHPTARTISLDDVNAGIAAARRRMGSLVHEPTLADTSDVDRSFLLAMARDDGPSLMSDVAKRLDVDANYAGQYRLRLIEAEIIHPVRRGVVDFALPNLREYLREHAAADLGPYGAGSVLPDD